MHIVYELKNDVEYGKLCTSKREGKNVRKTSVNLGRVLDKERGIFQNRKQGFSHSQSKKDMGKLLLILYRMFN